MVSKEKLEALFRVFREKAQENDFPEPLSHKIVTEYNRDPFLILVSCLLSLRARDIVVADVVEELFEHVKTPQDLIDIDTKKLEDIIQSTGFYHQKAKTLKRVARVLQEKHNGKVPDTYDELVAIKGVGPKTANLVLGEAFKKPAIAVDTHVHRIANHLGIVDTKDVAETQKALEEKIPKAYWDKINHYFVLWGQNGCTPQQSECTCPTDIL